MRFRKQLALLSIIGFWILGPMSSYASWEELPIPSGGAIVADLQFNRRSRRLGLALVCILAPY